MLHHKHDMSEAYPARAAAREKIVGWYHTGPRIREADLDISALLGSYCDNPLLVICEVEVRSLGGQGRCWSCLAVAAWTDGASRRHSKKCCWLYDLRPELVPVQRSPRSSGCQRPPTTPLTRFGRWVESCA